MYRYGINTNILYLTFNNLIILYKMLIIAGILNENTNKLNHTWNIMPKRHSILQTRTSFFISSAAKIGRVEEFKIKLFA